MAKVYTKSDDTEKEVVFDFTEQLRELDGSLASLVSSNTQEEVDAAGVESTSTDLTFSGRVALAGNKKSKVVIGGGTSGKIYRVGQRATASNNQALESWILLSVNGEGQE